MIRREDIEPISQRELVTSLAHHWTDTPIAFVRNFNNLVYRLPGTPTTYLRITPETHRSPAQIESELQVIRYIGAHGDVATSQPVPSRHGSDIHTAIAHGVIYSACVFDEAQGSSFVDTPPTDVWQFFREAGRTMGRLHTVLSCFEPSRGFVRFTWFEDRWAQFANYVPPSEHDAWDLFSELRDWTAQLSQGPEVFGLIHGDFTIANMHLDGSKITLFDSDGCCPHWWAYEIAVFLHYFSLKKVVNHERAYDSFLDGYAQVRSVTAPVLEAIPLFGKMRLLRSFMILAEEWGFDNLNTHQNAAFEQRRQLFRSSPIWPSGR